MEHEREDDDPGDPGAFAGGGIPPGGAAEGAEPYEEDLDPEDKDGDGDEAAFAPILQFQTWQAFIHNVPRRNGGSAPTHFRYCRWGTQRHRWLDEGHYFDLNVSEDNPELPSLHHGDYEVQLYHKYGPTQEGKGGKRTYYMTPVPLRPLQPNMRLRVQFVGRGRRSEAQARPPAQLPVTPLGPVRDGVILPPGAQVSDVFVGLFKDLVTREDQLRTFILTTANQEKLEAREKAAKAEKKLKKAKKKLRKKKGGWLHEVAGLVNGNPEGVKQGLSEVAEVVFGVMDMLTVARKKAEDPSVVDAEPSQKTSRGQ